MREQIGEWFWSCSEETWNEDNGPWPSRYAAVIDGVDQARDEDAEAGGFYTGRRKRFSYADLIDKGDVEHLIEQVDERLGERCGDAGDGQSCKLPYGSLVRAAYLFAAILDTLAAETNDQITCWTVTDIEWHAAFEQDMENTE